MWPPRRAHFWKADMTITHIGGDGAARMVDISGKNAARREAVAAGHIRMNAEARAALVDGEVPKGDVFAAARLAGIMAAKRTAELIPLCHPLPLSGIEIELTSDSEGMAARARIVTTYGTGAEMEALTAVSIALLTVYDMLKAIDKGMVIGAVRLLSKSGGKSGDWTAN